MGVAFAWSERFGMQLLCIQNVSGVAQSADFTIMLSAQWRPWAVSTDLPPIGSLPPPTSLPPVGPASP